MASRAYSEHEGVKRQRPPNTPESPCWYARMRKAATVRNALRSRRADGRKRAGARQQALDVARELLVGSPDHAARGDEHHPVAVMGEARPATPDDLAQAAPGAVALHGSPHALLARDEAQPGGLAGPRQHQQQAVAPAERRSARLHG